MQNSGFHLVTSSILLKDFWRRKQKTNKQKTKASKQTKLTSFCCWRIRKLFQWALLQYFLSWVNNQIEIKRYALTVTVTTALKQYLTVQTYWVLNLRSFASVSRTLSSQLCFPHIWLQKNNVKCYKSKYILNDLVALYSGYLRELARNDFYL